MMHSTKQITKALISLCRCADWSVPLLFTNPEDRLSHIKAHLIFFQLQQILTVVFRFELPEDPRCLKRLAQDMVKLFLSLYGSSLKKACLDLSSGFPNCQRMRDTKESTCLLRHITTEKSGLCQYAVCITRNTRLKQ